MYKHIMIALDGSKHSDFALEAGVTLAEKYGATLTGCHVYAAKLHRTRFTEMEPGLPGDYQTEDKLNYLRDTHEMIITDGLEIISDAYLKPLFKIAYEKPIKVQGLTPEGHNYVEFLKSIESHEPELVVMGARGHGIVPVGRIGSFCERVVLGCRDRDILITRRNPEFEEGLIVVGIDGSENSYTALERAAKLAEVYHSKLALVAVYDPFFHTGVFRHISNALTEEERTRFNFQAQEKLHDEIIDKGLETLYKRGLQRGVEYVRSLGLEADSEVLSGKVFPEILKYASDNAAALVVVGRWGLHKEDVSLLGSNTVNLVREIDTNLLIAAPSKNLIKTQDVSSNTKKPLKWTTEAEKYLERVPSFARGMARKAIETRAIENGLDVITFEHVVKFSEQIGMKK